MVDIDEGGDFKLQTNYGFTALHFATQVGNVSIAEQLVEKNNELLSITDDKGDTPLIVAAYVGHTNMVSYLFSLNSTPPKPLTQEKCIELLGHTIRNDMYDIALKILESDTNIANADTECWWEALETLAKKPAFSIGSESRLSFWKSLLNSCFKGICLKALMKTLAHQLVDFFLKKDGIKSHLSSPNLVDKNMTSIFEAVKVGNVEFLIVLSRSYPSLIWQQDEKKMSIFHTAILYRQESVFNLIYEIGAGMHSLASYVTEDNKENMLHLAGKLAPSDRLNIVSGAALQMQRELLWFKKDGEQWMKDRANYCMVVAALIATVMFAAAFTVPGGNDQTKGTPIFLEMNWFMAFFISDAIALCFSSTSIIIFMSILTSRYREDDFLKSLPLKLLFGLATLFISMTGMMVAFNTTFFLVYTSARAWTPAVVITLTSIPIVLFGPRHCKIWVDT
ncbi:ankyrin repeat-containing protein NPR4-like [Corylus avellana]|uniref:ankyrin repeat-containing protein NPR4-like n=1 Tax=Corylus avellana TaxID=13451 RepID=UPI00286AB578|nr:ankyrin repeat-containing protein NPR4-like [Corylus avellana]